MTVKMGRSMGKLRKTESEREREAENKESELMGGMIDRKSTNRGIQKLLHDHVL